MSDDPELGLPVHLLGTTFDNSRERWVYADEEPGLYALAEGALFDGKARGIFRFQASYYRAREATVGDAIKIAPSLLRD